jgi:O-antigen/teichoic acid export membrane protein
MSGQIVFQVDRLIVAAFLPIRAVTLYSVPLSIAQRFTVVQFIFSGAFFPAASELHGIQQQDRLRRLYLASLKLSLVMILPLVILVAGFSHQILETWIGAGLAAASANVLLVLAIAYGVATFMGVPALASDATGHAHWTAAFAIASAVINLTLTLILVPRLGPIGAAYALLINAVTQGLAFVVVVQQWFLRVSLLEVLKSAVVRPVVAAAVLVPYVVIVGPHLHRFSVVIAAIVGGSLIYAACGLAVRVWDRQELDVARALATGAVSAWRRTK